MYIVHVAYSYYITSRVYILLITCIAVYWLCLFRTPSPFNPHCTILESLVSHTYMYIKYITKYRCYIYYSIILSLSPSFPSSSVGLQTPITYGCSPPLSLTNVPLGVCSNEIPAAQSERLTDRQLRDRPMRRRNLTVVVAMVCW